MQDMQGLTITEKRKIHLVTNLDGPSRLNSKDEANMK